MQITRKFKQSSEHSLGELRVRRRLESARRTSRLPHLKTLEDFDFALQPSVERAQLESLCELGFLQRHENVVFCGPPGVGKTHLATSLGVSAIVAGRSVYFTTLREVMESLHQAQGNGTLKRRLGVSTRAALLIVDEIGYLPLSEDGGRLFFQLVNARHERGSMILTTNKGFDEWGSVVGDEVMAAAMLDRLLHRCHLVNIRGNGATVIACGNTGRCIAATVTTVTKPKPRAMLRSLRPLRLARHRKLPKVGHLNLPLTDVAAGDGECGRHQDQGERQPTQGTELAIRPGVGAATAGGGGRIDAAGGAGGPSRPA